ncbi:hypothetical protein [Afifella marina]|uniref:Uncharacterized protein n=1 Tax=Afifella marina DSM 2698 TaxID=1120955 RepID=A0A1G5N3D1_AFIMA|nr:hypothetical protein [Afifella marina]SCZ31654.1 hypothetical protein SAMN03080610_01392 [Afifella marina DSM 2698]
MSAETQMKLQAKRFNEHVKLFSSTVNAIGLVIFGGGLIQPLIARDPSPTIRWSWIALSIILHMVAQSVIRLMRAEEGSV